MYFSKEIIKKDIPLLLQSYFQGKYFDRCGSVHLGTERDMAEPEAVSADGALRYIRIGFFPPHTLQMVVAAGTLTHSMPPSEE